MSEVGDSLAVMELITALVLVAAAAAIGLLAGFQAGRARGDGAARRTESALARTRAELEAERRVGAERLAALQGDHAHLTAQFRALAADALEANSRSFLGLAEQRLRVTTQAHEAELARREEAVRRLVDPLTHTLDQVRTELTDTELARREAHAALAEQVRAMRESSELLRGETSQLVTALRAPQVRGRWGELQLRRVVEAAGMLPHVDFVEQTSTRTQDGLLRPDMVVRLAGGKSVVVDAKVPFLGYLEASQARDDAARAERLAAHARHVRAHIEGLGAKRYWAQFAPAPEFVVMFLPAESFLSAALEQDPALLERAFDANVVLATPTTLVALLRTVAYTWRQEAITANAQEVLRLGTDLHERLATLGGHVGRLGRQLDGAVRAYNATVSSLESRVLVSARRFSDLGVTDAELEAPPQLATVPRSLQAPELVVGDPGSVVDLAAVAQTDSTAS